MLWATALSSATAHEDNSAELQQLTSRINASPADAGLFLRRAEMHRLIQHWHAAEADYRRAASLDPELPLIDLAFATMWNDADKPNQALPLLDHYLLRSPHSPDGYAERARARRMLRQWAAAAADCAQVLKHTSEPEPEVFAEYAAVLNGGGDPAQALDILNRALARLGRVTSLDIKALELEESMDLHDAALQRIEIMLAAPGRKETLLLRKARILLEAARGDEAKACVALAHVEFYSLPEARRLTSAGRQIAIEIERLESKTAKTQPTHRLQ